MSINIGDNFDGFVVTDETRKMVSRWSAYHNCSRYAAKDKFEQNIIQACLEDEYSEIKDDPRMMGVGLWAYNQAYGRA